MTERVPAEPRDRRPPKGKTWVEKHPNGDQTIHFGDPAGSDPTQITPVGDKVEEAKDRAVFESKKKTHPLHGARIRGR